MKNDLRNLVKFHASSRNLHFDGLFLSKVSKHLDEKVRKKSDAKVEVKLTLDSKNDMRNLVNFNASSGKSENLHVDVLLLSIAFKVSAKKVQNNYLS